MTLQLPAPTKRATVPLTVHTAEVVDANDTARPELDVALRLSGATPTDWPAGAVKLIVCATGWALGLSLPPQAPSASIAPSATAHARFFGTVWLMKRLRKVDPGWAGEKMKALSFCVSPSPCLPG